MNLNDDGTQISWTDAQHVLTVMAGILILMYILIQGKRSRNMSQHDDKQTNDPSIYKESESYISCQLPDCIRCQSKTESQLRWKEKFETFFERQTSENQLSLQGLCDSFRGNSQSLHIPVNGKIVRKLQNPTSYSYSRLKGNPWYDVDVLSSVAHKRDVQTLKDNFEVIKEDFERAYSRYQDGVTTGWSLNDVPTGSWSVFHLYNQGKKIEKNCILCADTTRILEGLETFMHGVGFGYACFSVLQPGSHITPHCGPCNIRLRCHLGIHIPDSCKMTVAGESRTWREGECLLFDDSFIHEAVNAYEGSANNDIESRVILMVDLWHPDLTDIERQAFRSVFSTNGKHHDAVF